MGKGDKRTRKGKIVAGSFGKSRPKKKNTKKAVNETTTANDKTENKEA
jgi:30S ribosomal protein S31